MPVRAAGLLLVSSAMLLCLSGCDTLVEESDPITLQPKQATFEFELLASGVQPGSVVTLTSRNSVDLAEALQEDGFVKDEVLSATILSAQLRQIFPLSQNLSVLESAELKLQGGNLTASVATLGTMPPQKNAAMGVDQGQAVRAFVVSPSIRAVLDLLPASLTPGEEYTFEVTVAFSIVVEGL